ncbi:B12-binding domain-containing radical SAM protein [Desulfosporosinus youngiae]|uniref:Fe-S oxidoreductase n=1 Tax=Desulfosporosinus youngiae DSM 17734 TaxID=768710 RepID=H5Y3V8_9FIRM|nr:radical SAM protein [Desulfosporosinus youngiae]EHQ89496.1 Fe-S oxidoreductase [Desulfosporosinus youngiae DSM 17734]
MNELHLYSLEGLFYEFSQPDLNSLRLEPLDNAVPDSLRRANGLFWAQHLKAASIHNLLNILANKHHNLPVDIVQYAAILEKPQLFVERCQLAIHQIVNQATDVRDYFGALETLSILCKMYSELIYFPHTLTISDGFALNQTSSQEMLANCMIPSQNPYLKFLEEEVFPVILSNNPDLVWLHGRITMSTMAMAVYIKKNKPTAHISVVNHSSEYYSLNKITSHLMGNQTLFSIIDSIVLEETNPTMVKLRQALAKGQSLEFIKNLIFVDHNSGHIHQNPYSSLSSVTFDDYLNTRPRSLPNNATHIDPYEILSAKLFPEIICPWRQCTFCGINSKYHVEGNHRFEVNIDEKLDKIEHLLQEGRKYFWFIDEAIPPSLLAEFAKGLLRRKINIFWQVRSRFDGDFNLELCELLYASGLREIRFGLESASSSVLRSMNKFSAGFELDTVEHIVAIFHSAGISVHCPLIIGFPGETPLQRKETYHFLTHLKRKYQNFTFNINILEMDVSSNLYLHFEEFEITALKLPCSSRYFLGNSVEAWGMQEGWFDKSALLKEQNNVMRGLMYPWMPPDAIIPVNIFYRLSETIRATLIWKTNSTDSPLIKNFDIQIKLYIPKWVTSFLFRGIHLLFHLCYYISIQVSPALAELLSAFNVPQQADLAIRNFLRQNKLNEQYFPKLTELVRMLYMNGFLVSDESECTK